MKPGQVRLVVFFSFFSLFLTLNIDFTTSPNHPQTKGSSPNTSQILKKKQHKNITYIHHTKIKYITNSKRNTSQIIHLRSMQWITNSKKKKKEETAMPQPSPASSPPAGRTPPNAVSRRLSPRACCLPPPSYPPATTLPASRRHLPRPATAFRGTQARPPSPSAPRYSARKEGDDKIERREEAGKASIRERERRKRKLKMRSLWG